LVEVKTLIRVYLENRGNGLHGGEERKRNHHKVSELEATKVLTLISEYTPAKSNQTHTWFWA